MTSPHEATVTTESRKSGDPDSRARTHLANERTFLAWLRTGLSLVAVGLAAAKFLPIELVPGVHYVTLFALLLVVLGILMIGLGASRFVSGQRQIDSGSYRQAVNPILLVAILVAILGVMAIPLVLELR